MFDKKKKLQVSKCKNNYIRILKFSIDHLDQCKKIKKKNIRTSSICCSDGGSKKSKPSTSLLLTLRA